MYLSINRYITKIINVPCTLFLGVRYCISISDCFITCLRFNFMLFTKRLFVLWSNTSCFFLFDHVSYWDQLNIWLFLLTPAPRKTGKHNHLPTQPNQVGKETSRFRYLLKSLSESEYLYTQKYISTGHTVFKIVIRFNSIICHLQL